MLWGGVLGASALGDWLVRRLAPRLGEPSLVRNTLVGIQTVKNRIHPTVIHVLEEWRIRLDTLCERWCAGQHNYDATRNKIRYPIHNYTRVPVKGNYYR